MKRVLLVLFGLTLLGACGSEGETQESSGTQEDSTEEKAEEEMSQAEWMEVYGEEAAKELEEQESKIVDDPMKVSEGDIYQGYTILDSYTNEDTEDGFNYVNFQGYEVTFSFKVVEYMEGEKEIAMFAETVNNTDYAVQYNADMVLKTSEQEQATNMTAIGETDPGIKTKGMVSVPLQYDVPDSFEVTLEPPFKVVGEYEYEEGHFGEAKTMTFTKQ